MFDCFLKYKLGLEVLACSFDTNLNYMTIVPTVPSLKPLSKIATIFQKNGAETFWVYSHRYVTPTVLSPGPEALC